MNDKFNLSNNDIALMNQLLEQLPPSCYKKTQEVIITDKFKLMKTFSMWKKGDIMALRLFAWPSQYRDDSISYIINVKKTKDIKFVKKYGDYVSEKLNQIGCNFSDFIITTPPRGNSIKIGWTLAFKMAEYIAKKLNIEYIQAFKDKEKSSHYSLDLSCKQNFKLIEPIQGKKIILFDDVMTTGTTMNSSMAILNKDNFVFPVVLISGDLKRYNDD